MSMLNHQTIYQFSEKDKIACCIFAWVILLVVAFPVQAKVLHAETSLYQHVIVSEVNNRRCLKFSNRTRISNQSCQYQNRPNALVFTYTKLLLTSVLAQQDPKSILVIGLGAGTMPTVFRQLFPKATVESLEIDPVVVTMAKQYFAFRETSKNVVHTIDARVFVKRAARKNKQYDLIIVDAFNGEYIPEHLMTKEFFEEVKAILSPNGVLASNTFTSSRLAQYETETYLSVFRPILQMKASESENRVFVFAQQKSLLSEENLKQGAEKFASAFKKYDVLPQWLLAQKTVIDREANDKLLLTDQFSPVNILNSQ